MLKAIQMIVIHLRNLYYIVKNNNTYKLIFLRLFCLSFKEIPRNNIFCEIVWKQYFSRIHRHYTYLKPLILSCNMPTQKDNILYFRN